MANATNNYKQPNRLKVNDEIIYNGDVRLIYADDKDKANNFNKIVSINKAREIAENMNLDLAEINGKSNPPVMKILDFSKYLYNLKKNTKHKATTNTIKEIQLSTNISLHDLETKVNKAKKFIENGDKVKVVLTMRGRELLRRETSKNCFYKFIELMNDVSVPESTPKDENNKSIVILKKK